MTAADESKRWLRDLVELTKPSITRMCALTTAGGAALAPDFAWSPAIAAMIGASMAVASASAFNMWWERSSDPLMARTRNRPLAAKRMNPRHAFTFAALLGVLSLTILALGTNLLTTGLAALSIFLYVCVYTPLKYRTPLALVIGAVPGAAPPLLGWTAISGTLDAGGLALFAILFVWQMPHFLAITLYRKQELARAGIRCVPVVRGDQVAKIQALLWSLALVPIAILPSLLGVTGLIYGVSALVVSLIFFGWSVSGLWAPKTAVWARSFFFASLLFLPAVVAALIVDVLVLGS
ncbi:MAG: protoheme IX farnesyltransferase [Myxococcales bacterium]|nr:protoheme IX farnesyltransferase [Myxococcales bacterium]MCB9705308.1 protoheme IX farnesyltransferase [Myxococcales bacterium]